MSNPNRIDPPEAGLDGDSLPEDLKWLMTHFDLPKEDPTVVFAAWHWSRIHKQYEAITTGGMLLKSVLDPRIAQIGKHSEVLEKLQPNLEKMVNYLGQGEAGLVDKLHDGLQKPMDQIAQEFGKLLNDMKQQWWELTWKQWLTCFIGGMALGSILTLCAISH